jgi:tryptophan halogenase
MDPLLRDRFNSETALEWERVRDFIIAHYHLTEREDSEFWRYTKNMTVPDSLTEVLETWRARGVLAIPGNHLFQTGSWASVLIGQRFLPQGVHALTDRISPEEIAEDIRKIHREAHAAAAGLPDHADYLAGYCSAEAG